MNTGTGNNQVLDTIPPNVFNRFFANNSYDAACLSDFADVPQCIAGCSAELHPISEFVVEKQLRTLKNSSPGADLIPAWVFRQCSYELAYPVMKLFNMSFAEGQVPTEWRSANVTPVPKVSKPSAITDFRPVSVTPLLSRLAERMIIKQYLEPAVGSEMLDDQYAFRPTGSTAAALACLMHRVTECLELAVMCGV